MRPRIALIAPLALVGACSLGLDFDRKHPSPADEVGLPPPEPGEEPSVALCGRFCQEFRDCLAKPDVCPALASLLGEGGDPTSLVQQCEADCTNRGGLTESQLAAARTESGCAAIAASALARSPSLQEFCGSLEQRCQDVCGDPARSARFVRCTGAVRPCRQACAGRSYAFWDCVQSEITDEGRDECEALERCAEDDDRVRRAP